MKVTVTINASRQIDEYKSFDMEVPQETLEKYAKDSGYLRLNKNNHWYDDSIITAYFKEEYDLDVEDAEGDVDTHASPFADGGWNWDAELQDKWFYKEDYK